MGMKPLDTKEACGILNEIMEYELAGVVRYTHSAMMVTGPYRIPIVAFLKEQAAESLLHAPGAGELIAGLDGHPSQKIAKIEDLISHRLRNEKLIKCISNKKIKIKKYGSFDLKTFRNRLDGSEHYAITKGKFSRNKASRVRVISTNVLNSFLQIFSMDLFWLC